MITMRYTGNQGMLSIKQLLYSTWMLWLLFWINFLGTIYGYMWYWQQLVETYETRNPLLLPFVPDSPTASLFFTISLLFMIGDRSSLWRPVIRKLSALRALVDALAVITLVKYGIWAVVMNLADGWQGGQIDWQQWMLIASHTGMAVEAVIYAKLMRNGWVAITAASIWTILNDFLDYGVGIYPWLYPPLEDDLAVIRVFTHILSFVCIALALALWRNRLKGAAINSISD